MAVGNLPDHEFESAHYNFDASHPNAICLAMIQTASVENNGYDMFTQCGHMRMEHEEK